MTFPSEKISQQWDHGEISYQNSKDQVQERLNLLSQRLNMATDILGKILISVLELEQLLEEQR